MVTIVSGCGVPAKVVGNSWRWSGPSSVNQSCRGAGFIASKSSAVWCRNAQMHGSRSKVEGLFFFQRPTCGNGATSGADGANAELTISFLLCGVLTAPPFFLSPIRPYRKHSVRAPLEVRGRGRNASCAFLFLGAVSSHAVRTENKWLASQE